ncbi:winged helix-turn-helix transcriptional regulator [Flexivirga aerilata]
MGERWSLLICRELNGRAMRFSELRTALPGVSSKVLSSALQRLEEDRLVRRDVTCSRPPRVRYALTPAGESLYQQVTAMAEWIKIYGTLIGPET